MRRIWRLVCFVSWMFSYTLLTSLSVRRRPASERPAFRALRQQRGCAMLCRILKIRVVQQGASLPTRPMLYVCNHLGLADAMMLAARMPVAFAAKAEVRTWPLLGWVCRTMGVLFVERERPTRTSAFVRDVRERLGHGVSVLVFPEGTTGSGDHIRPFKTGAFEAVADQEDGAVLPLCLKVLAVDGEAGRRSALAWVDEPFARNSWRLLGLPHAEVAVQVGEPLATDGSDRKELARQAHAAVSQLARPVVPQTD